MYRSGGENQQVSLNHTTRYSIKAHRKGTAYLEPNSDSLQKPIEGLSTALPFGLYIAPLNKGAIEKNHTTGNRAVLETFIYTINNGILESHG
jgi:hypothetical protein